jgi:hypothetical protein
LAQLDRGHFLSGGMTFPSQGHIDFMTANQAFPVPAEQNDEGLNSA